jgi:hypothetical protein
MFCSKCGQEQLESVRFCSRCGFESKRVEERLGKRLVKLALYLVLAMCSIFGWGSFTAGPGYMQLRVIITLIAAITFYLLFWRDLKHIFHELFSKDVDQLKQVSGAGQQSVLPPAQSMPVPTLASHRVNTAEMAQPASITEHTTRLLDNT